MQVLSIGTDRKLFEEGSAVLARNIEYAKKMDELYIIVFSLKKLGLEPKIVGNLHIYPTNSTSRLNYIFNAYSIGKQVVENLKLKIGNSRDVVISCQDPFETGLVGYFLKNKFGFSLQLQIHTDFLSPYFKNSFLNIIRARIARFLIPRANGLRIVSETIMKSIKKHFSNIGIVQEVLPIFIDIEKIINIEPRTNLATDFPQFRFIMLMASRLTREKRIDVALHTFKKVVEEFPQVGLIISGEGEERKKLEGLTKKLGLTRNVVFVGWQNDLISYYKTANLFLLTSEYEGYGMTLIEAGASGCPIVTTQVGIANTPLFINNKNSIVCPVGDMDCIFKAISELVHDSAKRELFKREMQDNIKKMVITKEEYIAKYVSLLEKLT